MIYLTKGVGEKAQQVRALLLSNLWSLFQYIHNSPPLPSKATTASSGLPILAWAMTLV